jgi:hypothetical protein
MKSVSPAFGNPAETAGNSCSPSAKQTPQHTASGAIPAAIRLPLNFFEQATIRILHGQKDGVYTVHLFLMLLSLAAKSNRDGALMLTDDLPYDEAILLSLIPLDAKQLQPALQLLTRYGLIAQQDGIYRVTDYARWVEFVRPRVRKPPQSK